MAHILLVDDDHDIREIGRALLTQARHQVTIAESGTEALAILRHLHSTSTQVDVVLTDVNMPELSGFDLIREIRADHQLAQLTIVLLTARRERADIERAVALGVRDYIVKPLDPLLFLQKIRDLLPAADSSRNENANGGSTPPELPNARVKLAATATEGAATKVDENPTPDFATTQLRWTAKATTEIEIISLSEIGVSVRTQTSYAHGSKVWLETNLFEHIGIEAPYMKVVASLPLPSGAFETRITFFGLSESSLSKIRAWVQKEVVKNAHSSR